MTDKYAHCDAPGWTRRAALAVGGAATAALALTRPLAAMPQRWSLTAHTAGPGGGTLVGNPDAPIKLAEYFSFTCGHCGAFARASVPELYRDHVDSGQVSMEYRNLLRDPLDLAVALLAQADGHAGFSGHFHALMAAQDDWLKRAVALPDTVKQAWYSGPLNARLERIVRDVALDAFMAERGVVPARAMAALNDSAVQQALITMTNRGVEVYGVNSTPTFLINDAMLDGVHDWPTLKSRLDAVRKTA